MSKRKVAGDKSTARALGDAIRVLDKAMRALGLLSHRIALLEWERGRLSKRLARLDRASKGEK